MKRIISILLAAAFLLTSMAMSTFAAEPLSGKCGENMTWTLDLDSGELVISGEGEMFLFYSTYENADGYWYYGSRPSEWGANSSKIKTVIIENGVTTIRSDAFEDFVNLKSVTIPPSVASVGSLSRWGNLKLDSIYYTGDLAGWCAIDFGDSVVRYADNLYINNTLVEGDLVIPEGVTSIGENAFYNYQKIENLAVPESVTSIGECAFSGCDSLMKVTFKDSPADIGGEAFSGCDSLVKVTLGDSIKSIGNGAFRECVSLTGIDIPDTTEAIGTQAFYGCSSIRSLSLGKEIENIGENAFWGCYSITEVTVDPENPAYSNDEYGVWFNKQKTELIKYTAGNKRTSYEIPDSVIYMQPYAFNNAKKLTSVTINKSLTAISDYAFSGCTALESIVIPDNVRSIGYSAFYGCGKLSNATIGNGVTTIGGYAFYICDNLESVTIGSRVKSIGEYAFGNCWNLKSVIIPDSVRTIGRSAFNYCYALDTVTIGRGITNISKGLFSSCSGIKSITIPVTVTSISYSAFSGCNNISDVYYEGTEELWEEVLIAADNGTILDANVHFGDVEDIVLQSCGDGLTWTFYEDNGELEISGEGDMYDFSAASPAPWNEYGDQIKKVTIESGVTSIGDNAFESCSSVTYTAFKGTKEQWDAMSDGEGNEALANGMVRCGEAVVAGDIDGDIKINSSDALYCLKNSVQSLELMDDAVLAADVTKDGRVNSSDALKILKFAVGAIETL